jgi:LysR family transcriptional activator of nhaA
MRWLNYHHLGHFRAVAQAGGLTAAAKVLRIAPSTLSEQIKQLESALGQPLFRRTGRGLTPTVFGARVLEYADRIFGLGSALMHEVESGPSGPLRVGVVDALPNDTARRALMPSLQAGARLTVLAGAADALFALLQANGLDVLLLDEPLAAADRVPGARQVRLLDEPAMVWGTPGLVAQARADWPAAMGALPWVLPTRGTALRRRFDQWAYAQGWAVEPQVECASQAMAVSFASAGVGLCVAPLASHMPGLQVLTDLPAVRETTYALVLPQAQRPKGLFALIGADA